MNSNRNPNKKYYGSKTKVFNICYTDYISYCLQSNSDEELIRLGNFKLWKEEKKEDCYFIRNRKTFSSFGMEKELINKEGSCSFTPKRILVIQTIKDRDDSEFSCVSYSDEYKDFNESEQSDPYSWRNFFD